MVKDLVGYARSILLFCFSTFACLQSLADAKKFVILTASYNNIEYYKWNLDSVFNQTYDDWELVYVDDMSSDGTREAVQEYIKEKGFEDKVRFVANTDKCYCLKNYYREIHKLPDDTIIVTLDGDDALADASVLDYLNEVYSDPNVWCTYGNFDYYPPGSEVARPITLKPFPQEIVEENTFREYEWNIHHLRSFYAGLFKNIKLEDFLYQGLFFPVGEDLAFMFPIIEQAGKHHRFIDKVLYSYNIGNPLITVSVWKRELRKCIWEFIYRKREYEPLEKPPYHSKNERNYRADLLIFNEHGPKHLHSCLESVKKLRALGKIFVIRNDDESKDYDLPDACYISIKKEYPTLIFVDETEEQSSFDCFLDQAKEEHTIIVSDRIRGNPHISIRCAIQQLEKTGAYVVHFQSFKSFLDNHQDPVIHLEDHLSAFQFGHFKASPKCSEFFALYRRGLIKKKCGGKSCTSLGEVKECLENVNPQKVVLVIT